MTRVLYLTLLWSGMVNSAHFSVYDDKFLCPKINNSLLCAQVIEKNLLSQYPSMKARPFLRKNKNELHVIKNNKIIKVYKDGQDPIYRHEKVTYTVLEMLPTNKHLLILRQFHEGAAYLVLDIDSGYEMYMNGYPLMSTNLKYMLVSHKDLDAGYAPNIFKLYLHINSKFELIFDAKPNAWAPDNVTWLSDTQVTFNKVSLNPNYATEERYELFSQELFRHEPFVLMIHEEDKVNVVLKNVGE